MANNSEKYNVKMSGYLEKKGKLKMMSSWKSHWFVLEGRLLLYYRSKDEYDALSPCKGSINLGPSCSVEPLLGTSCVFQIQTRANTVILKARTRLEQQKWMQAIVAALNHNYSSNGMLHFRYSSDDLIPRRTLENRSALSRQYTLPSDRLKVEKRHTFCRSFETLQSAVQKRPNSMIIPKTNNAQSVMIENAEYCSSDRCRSIIKKDSAKNLLDIRNESSSKEIPQISTGYDEEYYAISAPTEEEREYLRKKSLDRHDHIYERISGDSRLSTNSREVLLDNDTYMTASEVKKSLVNRSDIEVAVDNDIYAGKTAGNSDEEALIENDQYCTPDIIVRDTDLVSYHEYNLPNRDNHIYSTPNSFDHNENRISRREEVDVNPYALCHIYPKSSVRSSDARNYDVIYDNPVEYSVAYDVPQTTSNVGKLLRKFMRMATNHDKERRPKKDGFLKKLFRRAPDKKKEAEPEVEAEVEEEIEYAQIDEEAIKKMDMAYCIDKKLLAELEIILQMKKRKLEEYLGETDTSVKDLDDHLTDSKSKQRTSTSSGGTIARPKIPIKPRKQDGTIVSVKKDKYNNLKTIDDILDDLEEMKRNNSLTSGKVRCLIEKFDKNVKKSDETSRSSKESLIGDVVVRSRKEAVVGSREVRDSDDELDRLLCELTKVTNAPILKPGVTSSLGASSNCKGGEFLNLIPKSKRRHSEPDYDVPRPHTNLKIMKDNENVDNVLTATRFFGPAMPNYENKQAESPLPFVSMSPDSLEIETTNASNSIDTNMASYSSHKYENCNRVKKISERTRTQTEDDEEAFIDSLEPHNHDCL